MSNSVLLLSMEFRLVDFDKKRYAYGSSWDSNSFVSNTADISFSIRVSADIFFNVKCYFTCIGSLIGLNWQKML